MTDKTVAVVQSNYIPWKGYFDLIRASDTFVLYDDVQYTRRDWRNRNRIKTATGVQWLTIPVEVKGRYTQKIREVRISDDRWRDDHWKAIRLAYGRAPHFKEFAGPVEHLYSTAESPWLSEINRHFIAGLCDLLGISRELRSSSEFSLSDGKTERLLNLCRSLDATRYLSGPAAKDYLDVELFANAGIAVDWMQYDGYPTYPQLHGTFEHGVTILDLLFNTGRDAMSYLRRVPEERR